MTVKASVKGSSPYSFTSTNPATGEVISELPAICAKEALNRLRLVDSCQRRWAERSVAERCRSIFPLARRLRDSAQILAQLVTIEMGKPTQQALDEVEKCARTIEFYCENAEEFLKTVRVQTENKSSYVCYKPLGTVLGVLPWNFPVWQTIRACIPAILAGNAFAFKHAPNVQMAAARLEEIFGKVDGFPNLCINLPVPVDTVSELISSSHIQAVTFTGSSTVGSKIAAMAGSAIKPCILELGGSDPYIVLEDADLKLAATVAAAARMHNSGQSCIGAKRIIVVKPVATDFTKHFTEALAAYQCCSPENPDCKLGPLARLDLRENLHEQVTKSIDMGAECLLGGSAPDGPGFYYPATLLLNPPRESPVLTEEVFGPVASLCIVDDEDAAIALANESDYALGAAIFSKDSDRAETIVRDQVRAGFVAINSQVKSDPRLPFGGVGQSGFGRELGAEGLRAFTNLKTVVAR